MKDILEEIIAEKRKEIAAKKAIVPTSALALKAEEAMNSAKRSMKASLQNSRSGIISEFKRKSPSKGWIHADSEVTEVVPSYAAGGAAAISILTDEKYFGGNLDFIHKVRNLVETPILRKEFIIDEYQLLEARIAGADAVLLIASDLTRQECRHLTEKAHQLNLEVLLEIHDEKELDYLTAETDMLGVNNRHLGTFHTNVQKSFDIAQKLPCGFTLVSESGISSAETVKQLRQAGYRGFLIGEHFMKNSNPGIALRNFIQEIES